MILYSNDCVKCRILKAELDANGFEYELSSDYRKLLEKNIRSAPCLELEDGSILLFEEALTMVQKGR